MVRWDFNSVWIKELESLPQCIHLLKTSVKWAGSTSYIAFYVQLGNQHALALLHKTSWDILVIKILFLFLVFEWKYLQFPQKITLEE